MIFLLIVVVFADAPDYIPKFDIETKVLGDTETEVSQVNEESTSMAPSEMSMSIEVDMADASGMIKE